MTSPYAKAALFAFRLVALGLMIVSAALWSPDLFLYLSHTAEQRSGPALLVFKGVPFLLGVALYAKSRAFAVHLTKDLD